MSAGNSNARRVPAQEGIWGPLRDLRRLLQFQRTLGITGYPLNQDVRHFLESAAGPEKEPGRPAPNLPVQAGPPGTGIAPPALLAALEEEIGQCALCPLGASRLGTVPGRGGAGSRLMVVGDWSDQAQGCNPAVLFGPEEDAMLGKMMAAIGLGTDEVYVTNILKCCPGGPSAGQEAGPSCFSFLEREIAAVRPQVICAMGELAVTLLVAGREPLFRVRGRFGSYRHQSAAAIPVMPTFHPRYLLHHPELKKAAWKDLQAIRQRLDQIARSSRT